MKISIWQELEFAAAAATCLLFPNPPVGELPQRRWLTERYFWPGHQRCSTRPGFALTLVGDPSGNTPLSMLERVSDFDQQAILSAIDECYVISERRRKESRRMAAEAGHEMAEVRRLVEHGFLAGIVPQRFIVALSDDNWLGEAAARIIWEQVLQVSTLAFARGWPVFRVWQDAYLLPYAPSPDLLLHFRGPDYAPRTAFRLELARNRVGEVAYHPSLWTPEGVLETIGGLGRFLASDTAPEYTDPVAAIGSPCWPRLV